jgi:ABC-type antimicrobial peptide transport system permease subunit
VTSPSADLSKLRINRDAPPLRVTPGLLLAGLAFALVMGIVGGFFPARRAARQPVVQALR